MIRSLRRRHLVLSVLSPVLTGTLAAVAVIPGPGVEDVYLPAALSSDPAYEGDRSVELSGDSGDLAIAVSKAGLRVRIIRTGPRVEPALSVFCGSGDRLEELGPWSGARRTTYSLPALCLEADSHVVLYSFGRGRETGRAPLGGPR